MLVGPVEQQLGALRHTHHLSAAFRGGRGPVLCNSRKASSNSEALVDCNFASRRASLRRACSMRADRLKAKASSEKVTAVDEEAGVDQALLVCSCVLADLFS
jgi:hypothetical protein